jgi:hypothetical protein
MKYLQSKSVFEHLKIWEEFNDSVDIIVKNVKEILFDFSDDDNEVSVRSDFQKSESGYRSENRSRLQNLTTITVTIRNKTKQLDSETFIRLFTYMKESEYKCFYIFCPDSASGKIYIDERINIVDSINFVIDEINECRNLEMRFLQVLTD